MVVPWWLEVVSSPSRCQLAVTSPTNQGGGNTKEGKETHPLLLPGGQGRDGEVDIEEPLIGVLHPFTFTVYCTVHFVHCTAHCTPVHPTITVTTLRSGGGVMTTMHRLFYNT